MIVFVASILAILIVVFYKYVRYKQNYWKRLKVTSPDPTFLVGNFKETWTGELSQTAVNDKFYRKYKSTERVIGVYQMLAPNLLLLDPTLVKDICVKYFSNFHDSSFGSMVIPEADPLLARNPFFLTGQEWKNKRAEITPAFSPSRIKAMFPLVDDICGRLEKYLISNENVSLEARNLCSRFTVDVVSNCIFGADAESFVKEEPEIWTMARKIFGTGFGVTIRFLISMFLPFIARTFKIGFVPTYIQNFFSNLMAQAVEHRQATGLTRQDYLDYLLQMQGKKKVSDLELAANAITFFTDGFDTSSVAISCILYELAQNQDIQTRLRKELTNVSGYDELIEHEYLDLVFSESLRIHPPGAFTARECTTPIELDLLGKEKKLQLKKGDIIWIPIWSIHHDETIYEDPERFNPDRFADGALKQYRDDGLYLTFGIGPRTCIGQKFARAQSKACIATIIKNFEIKLDTQKTQLPLKLDPKEFVTYYTGGVWLRFKKLSV